MLRLTEAQQQAAKQFIDDMDREPTLEELLGDSEETARNGPRFRIVNLRGEKIVEEIPPEERKRSQKRTP